MTLQELQKQALKLSADERWQLLHALFESLKPRENHKQKRRNLSRLRGIASVSIVPEEKTMQEDYATYLMKKYQ